MIPKANDKVCNGKADVPMTHEGSHVEIRDEKSIHHFIRYQGYFVHFEFMSQGQTLNRAPYTEILEGLREAVNRKTP
jgi:hypothetical protein